MKNVFTLISFLIITIAASAQIKELPYTTGFDTPAEKQGWNEYRTGYLSLSHWQDGGQGFSGKGISHDYNVGGQQNQYVHDWYISPMLKFNSDATMTLKIFRSGFSSPFPESLVVYFISGDQNPINGDTTLIGNISDVDQGVWIDTSVAIPFLNDSGFIAFKYNTVGAAWTTYIIDNIEVKAATAGSKSTSGFNGTVKLYPTISNSRVTLEADTKAFISNLTYEIFSTNGNLVKPSQKIEYSKIDIEKTNLAPGLYLLNVKQSNGSNKTLRLIFE